ncbi:hypothetical protein G6R40_07230 [Chryseobacterium sp. POL2]|uniref:hypothetical protein n=1 Tax=Chryseobacterium sp. POL2 TaxID=2713414 RepID=UPI0013E12FA3|nr:hypothetical protein [Chryseobacterium sp. POL2]QIG89472.1 hypothetical protein G6R40_07230 [Chryseobacterium sp. POL2]
MKNTDIRSRLTKFQFKNDVLYTMFNSFEEAEQFARDNHGTLTEVGFLDGNDNPVFDDAAGLIAKKKYFMAKSSLDYDIIHSGNPLFKSLVAQYIERTAEIKEKSIEEELMSDSDALISEDGVFVVDKKGEIQSVTSRERVRYLMHTKVYELGVLIPKS